MATLALGALGATLGSSILPAGLNMLGLSVSGATLGSQIGAVVGSSIDGALFGQKQPRGATAPRLESLHVTGSAEGTVIPRVYGRARIGGQLIWASDLVEEIGEAESGGKSQRSPAQDAVDYRYFANIAVGLCEGQISNIGRVWADGKPFDLSRVTSRVYRGTPDQMPDPLIEQYAPANGAPAYRDLAYIVFERLPLAPFGNRIPQLSFEVFRPLDTFNQKVRSVVVIPGTGEFAYDTAAVSRKVGLIRTASENVNTNQGATDWTIAIDQLQATFPNVRSVSLVVSWFGDDLRVASCSVAPRVEHVDKVTQPKAWSVAGLSRPQAQPVSQVSGAPAYGGTPSDDSVIAAIQDLKARGLSVVFNPFILMDIPPASSRPDPYSNAASQPAYPWRGRITCNPAPGRPSTPDKTTAVSTQIAPFVGTAQPSNFTSTGGVVTYTGPDEWTYRRMILHYAALAKAAGGVDTFLLGSELRGLTTLRESSTSYPFVSALVALAADVKSILGPATNVTYAADWSGYFGHQPADGSGDVNFHLDPLWASSNVAAIGIDVYWPLADWRHTDTHIDRAAGHSGPHDVAYLKSNLVGGEGFDWFYASDQARRDQSRTPITDGLGKPWVFRFKDLKSWWSNAHFNRAGGIENALATPWVPQSKPIWIMELGCPAIDLGANQPNAFVDLKSIESTVPHFSDRTRDDLAQRRFLSAWLEAFDPLEASHIPNANPVSAIYGGTMLDPSRMYLYAWDARPFPAFPNRSRVWSDGANWATGHWLNGRGAAVALGDFVMHSVAHTADVSVDCSELTDTIDGIVVNRLSSTRDLLEPLASAFAFDAIERDGTFVFKSRRKAQHVKSLADDDLVELRADSPLKTMTRAQETDLPLAAKLIFASADGDYAQATVEARRHAAATDRVEQNALPLVMTPDRATQIAESVLYEAWATRDRAQFSLPPSALALEPGDVVDLTMRDVKHEVQITEIGDAFAREVQARSFDRSVYGTTPTVVRTQDVATPAETGQPIPFFIDIPPPPEAADHDLVVAAAQLPWPGPLALYARTDPASLKRYNTLKLPALVGVTRSSWLRGPASRLDYASSLDVEIDGGELHATTLLSLLNGANAFAIETATNVWEVAQFADATLIGPNTYRLTKFLRVQRGTDDALPAANMPTPPGARFVLLTSATIVAGIAHNDIGREFAWSVGPLSHAVGDPNYVERVHTPKGVGLRPLSPVHLRAARDQIGNITMTWIRRSRLDADRWDAPEIPLGEEAERYEIDILASPTSATVKRTLYTTTTSAAYSASAQVVDFGAPVAAVTVRIAQISARFGRGTARTLTL